MTRGDAPRSGDCRCDGSGWIIQLDRGRHASPGDAKVVAISRCPCSASVDAEPGPLRVALVAAEPRRRRRLETVLGRSDLGPAASVETVDALLTQAGAGYDVIVVAWARRDSPASVVAPAFRSLRRRFPTARLVGVTSDTRSGVVRGALEEHADGIVVELDVPRSLETVVRAVHAGFVVLPRELRERLAEPPLTMRERQVLAFLAAGRSNLEIASALDVAESTVKGHVSAVFAKLGIRSRADVSPLAASEAVRSGSPLAAPIAGGV